MEHGCPYDTCFFERYAKISLEQLLGARYANLKNCDRPDLQDTEANLAVEVTRAMRENKNAAHALINEIAGEEVTEVESEDFRDIRQYGYAYGLDNDGFVGSLEYNYWALALPMRRIIESKVQKVVDGFYGNFAECDLYVFSKEKLDDADAQNILDLTAELQYGKHGYKQLFISQIHSLYVCDLMHGTFQNLPIDSQQRHLFYKLAISNE